MHHLNMSYEEVLNTPMLNVSLFVSESTPKYEKKKDEVDVDTYYGTVKAKKKFII